MDHGQECLDDLGDTGSPEWAFPLRRVLWCAYAVLLTVSGVPSFVDEISSLGFLGVMDALTSAMSLLVLWLYIWDKRVLQPGVWKAWAFAAISWDCAFNFFIEPAVSHTGFDPWALMGAALLLPLYFALFRYGFRSWPSGESAATSTAS